MTTQHDIPGWTYEVREKSAGVYELNGRDTAGHSIVCSGVDPDLLVKECREYADECRSRTEVMSVRIQSEDHRGES
jgi:hypothetical protein